jgi:hypothetical protein
MRRPAWTTTGVRRLVTPAGPRAQRESFVRLDRVLELDERSLRREGAVLAVDRFELVCSRLREHYGWS